MLGCRQLLLNIRVFDSGEFFCNPWRRRAGCERSVTRLTAREIIEFTLAG